MTEHLPATQHWIEQAGDYFTQEELTIAAVLLLDNLLNYTWSEDKIELAIYDAMDDAKRRGLDVERMKLLTGILKSHARLIQHRSPMHRMLFGDTLSARRKGE